MRLLRYFLLLALVLALGYAGWWLFGRSPAQQVLAAQENLIAAVEDRDWPDVQALLTPGFTSTNGHTRETALADAEQVLSQFLLLTLHTELIDVLAAPDQATLEMKIRLEGTGSGLTHAIVARANDMKAPWAFHWQKQGQWPWQWKVTHIHHPDLPPPIRY